METTDVVSAGNPDIDAEGAQLRDSLQNAPLGGEITQESPETSAPVKEEASEKDQQLAAEAETKTKEEATKPDSPELPADEQKPESSYQKRKLERDKHAESEKRLADNWKKFQEEKQQIRQEMAELRQQLAQPRQQQQPQPQQTRFSSQHLVEAADGFEEGGDNLLKEAEAQEYQGDTDAARKSRQAAQGQYKLARQARQAAQQSYFEEQKEQYQRQQAEFDKSWRGTASQIIQAHPELADESQEIAQQMGQLLKAKPYLGQVPNGFADAYEHLSALRAARDSGLKDEKIASLEKQLKELQERTSIKGSGPTPRSDKNLGDLPMDEQGAELRRQLEDSERLAYA